MKIRIGILDSGVNKSLPMFSSSDIAGYSLTITSAGVKRSEDFSDNIGHGTAVYYLIDRNLREYKDYFEVINIRIVSQKEELTSHDFVSILEYIYLTEKFDYLNISSGFNTPTDIINMQKICNLITQTGCKIVSAYDNNGGVSFPAALDNIIGVDSHPQYRKITRLKKGVVDIFENAKFMRVPWVDGTMTLVKGNSYSCALVTAYLAKDQLLNKVPIATGNIKSSYWHKRYPGLIKELGRCIAFPFNKEIQVVAENEDLLNVDIIDYYSHRATGNVGKRICDIMPWSNNTKTIKSIDNIAWDDFDSIIIGHSKELSLLLKQDVSKQLFEKAKQYKKNIFSFDPIPIDYTKNNANFYYPHINNEDVPNNYGKLIKTNIPVLGVIGTSSRQGKFSLQLTIRRKLLELGYTVGQIGTEPSSQLFGMDHVYPCGYNSTVKLSIYNMIATVNQMIFDITTKQPDIIIVGTQNSVVAYNDYCIDNYPIYHQIFLQSTQPDAMVLCINAYDSVEYISQTIKAAEGLTDGKVISLVCFPMDIDQKWSVFQAKQCLLTFEKRQQLKRQMKKHFSIPMYMLDDVDDMNCLIDDIITFYS